MLIQLSWPEKIPLSAMASQKPLSVSELDTLKAAAVAAALVQMKWKVNCVESAPECLSAKIFTELFSVS